MGAAVVPASKSRPRKKSGRRSIWRDGRSRIRMKTLTVIATKIESQKGGRSKGQVKGITNPKKGGAAAKGKILQKPHLELTGTGRQSTTDTSI